MYSRKNKMQFTQNSKYQVSKVKKVSRVKAKDTYQDLQELKI